MSGDGEPIDLNSHVVLGDREVETHGFNLSGPVTDPLTGQSKAESPAGELGEDGVEDVEDTNSSQKGLCRFDEDEADANIGEEAGDNKILKGISSGNIERAEMRRNVKNADVKTGGELSITINDFKEAERGCCEGIHVSEEIPVVGGDEIVADDNQVVFEGGNGAATVNASPSDALSCREAKRKLATSLASLKEFTEAGVADATNEHRAIGIEHIVESQEGVSTLQNEEVKKVAQDGELAVGFRDLKCDQTVNINLKDSCHLNDGHNSNSHGNLGSDSPGSEEDTGQLTDDRFQKGDKLMESNELSPLVVTDMKTISSLECLENQMRKVHGQTGENQATGCHFLKTGTSIEIDEANLFDVVIEMDPHDIMGQSMEFNVSDLVWGKVRSHPWWPGQICDPSASTKKAMKYFKEDRYLVAFFGDHSFSWKEPSMIKPFQEYFWELQKQSNLESFHRAIDCALEEFSRRVEFGLACSCLSNELYSKLQTQTLANAGIRKKSSRRYGGDRYLTASSFDPVKLVNIVKEVARLPCYEADKLELVRAQAQLLAFNRWKGYYKLPEFNLHDVVLNYTVDRLGNESDIQGELLEDIAIDFKDDEVAVYGKGNLTNQNSSSGKRKHNSGDYIYSSKKVKRLPDLQSRKSPHNLNERHGSAENAASELKFHASNTQHEVVDAIRNNPAVKHSIAHVLTESGHESGQTNQTFRVGDRIRRVACKLNESNTILKHDDGISQTIAEIKGNGESTNMPKKEVLFPEYPVYEVLSLLCLAAINPMEGFGFLNSVVNFFSEFRKFVCTDITNVGDQETWELVSGLESGNELTKTGKRKEIVGAIEASDTEYIKDSYWTDRLIQGIAEDQSCLNNQDEAVECQIQTPSQNVTPTVENNRLICPGMNSTDQQPYERIESEAEKCMEDVYPTALILNFTDLGSVPSETNLNNIFRKYGDLYESKTEVMKKSSRAKVVFKKSADAETAFSSAGKFSIFGPSLVSYRLKYLPPDKVSPRPIKRRRKEMTSREENTT